MDEMKDKAYWVWLAGIPGVGPKKFYYLIEAYGSAEGVWKASREELMDFSPYLGSAVIHDITKHRDNRVLDSVWRDLDSKEFRIITPLDNEYPYLLKQIYDPPPVLYCKGLPLEDRNPLIAIVGSRRSTGYGRQMADKFAYELTRAGVTIVSGLARGIDAIAHYGAIRGEGPTIGVLGCGIDKIYPPENKKLYNIMEKKGTIVTEYPPGTQPLAGNFPARNRIISGLAQGVLVIEAGARSGTLITVDCALEQGRDVYALPGNISTAQSSGTNRLLKEGAKLVTNVQDILEDLGINNGTPSKATGSIQLDFLETQVYNALQEGEKHFEELRAITDIDPQKLNTLLTMLEVKGIVKQMPGRIFIRNWDA